MNHNPNKHIRKNYTGVFTVWSEVPGFWIGVSGKINPCGKSSNVISYALHQFWLNGSNVREMCLISDRKNSEKRPPRFDTKLHFLRQIILFLKNSSWFVIRFNRDSVQFSRSRLFETPWTAARQASLSITNSWSPPKPMSIESVMPSNHLILCRPLLLPSIFPSIMVF